MKEVKYIYYSSKFYNAYYKTMNVVITENVNGHDVENYMLYCNDLRKLRSNPIFDDDKKKYKLVFVRVA